MEAYYLSFVSLLIAFITVEPAGKASFVGLHSDDGFLVSKVSKPKVSKAKVSAFRRGLLVNTMENDP